MKILAKEKLEVVMTDFSSDDWWISGSVWIESWALMGDKPLGVLDRELGSGMTEDSLRMLDLEPKVKHLQNPLSEGQKRRFSKDFED